MHPQRPPRNDHSASNQDVMAAIAAAMASKEQEAAAEAIHQRQQHAHLPNPTPLQHSLPPQTAQPQAFPQRPAFAQPQVTPQPAPPTNPLALAPATQPTAPEGSPAAPSQVPEGLILRAPSCVAPQPEQQVTSTRKRSKTGLAISLSLVATLCLGVGGGFIWHRTANVPAIAQDTTPPVPETTPSKSANATADGILIPINNIPNR